MDTRYDHVIRNLIEAGEGIFPEGAPLRSVDDAAFEHRVNLRTRTGDWSGSQLLEHLNPGARSANLHASEILKRTNGHAAVEERFGGSHEERHGHHAENVFAPIAPELDSAPDVEPVQHPLVIHGASEAAGKNRSGISPPIIAGPRMAQISNASPDRISDLQGFTDSTTREDLNAHSASRELLKAVSKGLSPDLHQGPTSPPRSHAPGIAFLSRSI